MKIVRSGTWLYDGQLHRPVDIVALEVDFWYEIAAADDQLEPDEQPRPPGPDGVLYYVRIQRAGSSTVPTWVDSGAHDTIEEAMRTAEDRLASEVNWTCS